MNDQIIAKIKDNISILDLATKLGYAVNSHNKILSIYTQEKTPSLTLYKDTNTYYCFSAGAGGDIFKFYMDSQKVDFKTALKDLGNLANVGTENIGKNRHKMLTNANLKIENLNPEMLTNTGIEANSKVLTSNWTIKEFLEVFDYFISLLSLEGLGASYLKARGFDLGYLGTFKLKYFDKANYQTISNKLKAKFDMELLKDTGLFNDKDNLVCYFNSIVIPYLDKDLKSVYLQFRNIEPDTKIKYIWLSNTRSGLDKPTYFLDLALEALNNNLTGYKTKIWITEGVFDTLIVNQNMLVNRLGKANISIAIGSTNETKKLEGIFDALIENNRTGKPLDIVLAFDNDIAGVKAVKASLLLLSKSKYKGKLKPFEIDLGAYKDINEYILNC